MKLLSWNIWKGAYFDQVLKELKRHKADILCLQEVKEDEEEHQAKKIADTLGYTYATFPIFTTDRHTPQYTQHNSVLAREKITQTSTQYLSDLTHYQKDSTTEPRGVLIAHVSNYKILCTHLGFSRNLTPTPLQMRQVKKLLNFVDDKKCILSGDFNSKPKSPVIKNIEKKLVNTDNSNTPTRNVQRDKKEESRIDYIFTSPDIEFNNFQIHPTTASDHNILTIDIN